MSFTIAHITDPHLSPAPPPLGAHFRLKRFMGFVNWKRGRERLNDMALLGRIVADLGAQRPDHVAVTGDLVNIAMPAEFRRAAEWMATLGDPRDVSFVPGNHDAYVRSAMPLLASTFARWTTGDDGVSRFPYLRVRGEIAIIGLTSGVPTGPLMASGRLGRAQLDAFAKLLDETGARNLARVVLIHHPPLWRGAPPLRGLTDAADFERAIAAHGAEAVLHGHTHKQMVRSLPSTRTKIAGGRVPVLGAPSAAAAARDPRYRAAYHLVRLERDGDGWRVGARVRGLALDGDHIGEREPLPAPER
ncbi:3',5'-cyclic AMP phosphodiesterase CpdA [Roseiarcus fermentans]|uniref:3',5'-cyclic AMP phosphodiesterase CpdA n=1 Tax=Roseiarcus fermentans TaxID=1473586 RepID=A0A366FP53_9HYPH|nr:metallophosphoesterase [Roseiarcus fermentans]RBP15495.1 3',5'-cyclic AMP phosphodiesterase CpdA [Roseiarcus fermentans]